MQRANTPMQKPQLLAKTVHWANSVRWKVKQKKIVVRDVQRVDTVLQLVNRQMHRLVPTVHKANIKILQDPLLAKAVSLVNTLPVVVQSPNLRAKHVVKDIINRTHLVLAVSNVQGKKWEQRKQGQHHKVSVGHVNIKKMLETASEMVVVDMELIYGHSLYQVHIEVQSARRLTP